jgi:hypothetical protein
VELGDLGFDVWPLPRVPLRFILWRGEADIPASGSLLLRQSAVDYLGRMIHELVGLTVWRLKNIMDPEVKWGYYALAEEE